MTTQKSAKAKVMPSCCCFCGSYSYRTGTIVIAVIWLVINTINASVYAWYLLGGPTALSLPALKPFWMHDRQKQGQELDLRPETAFYTYVTATLCCLLIGALTNAAFSALMLVAALQNGPRRHLAPWYYFNLCGAIVSATWSILMTIYVLNKCGSQHLFTVVLILVIISAAHAYVFHVVHQYNLQLKREEGKAKDNGDGKVRRSSSQSQSQREQEKV